MSSPEVEVGQSSPNPEGSSGVPPTGLDGQSTTLNPPDATGIGTTGIGTTGNVTTGIVTTDAQDPAAETTVTADGHPGTRNPGAAVAKVTTDDQASSGAVAITSQPAGATVTREGQPVPQTPPAGAQHAGAMDGRGHTGSQDVVLTLQRHLLPTGLPIFPQVRLAGRYLVAAQEPGGGCFDAFVLAGGTIALMVGHAPGGGPQAVAAMAELRAILRQALQEGAGLPGALTQMDAFAAPSQATRGTTVCVALSDPATGSLRYASAGHPAPLVCSPGDGARAVSFLPASGGGPLGQEVERPTADTVLAPGALLLMCGDGTGHDPEGTVPAERFAAAAAAALASSEASPDASADWMCTAVAERLASGGPRGDATVLAAYRLPEPSQGLAMRFPAEPTALRPLRARLAEWLDEVGAAPADRVDTELAVYEAAANAIVHGRPAQGAATVAVDIGLDGTGGVLIEVTDNGHWRARSPGAERPGGRGLSVISKVTDELSISPSPDGTAVIMRRALTHPVTVDRAPA